MTPAASTGCVGVFFFFSSRRRHTRLQGDWSSDVCSSDLDAEALALARAHAAQHQVVATALAEVALDRLDLADHRAAQADRRQRRDAGDLDPRIDEAVGGVLRRELQVDELAHPAVRNPHANCLKNRRSFSKKRRMSSTPYLSIAMRSMPMPNAQPVTCSGS